MHGRWWGCYCESSSHARCADVGGRVLVRHGLRRVRGVRAVPVPGRIVTAGEARPRGARWPRPHGTRAAFAETRPARPLASADSGPCANSKFAGGPWDPLLRCWDPKAGIPHRSKPEGGGNPTRACAPAAEELRGRSRGIDMSTDGLNTMVGPVSGYASSSYVPVHGLRTAERATMVGPVSGYASSSYVPVHGLRTAERAIPGAAALFKALRTWNPPGTTQGCLRFEAGRYQPDIKVPCVEHCHPRSTRLMISLCVLRLSRMAAASERSRQAAGLARQMESLCH